MNSMIKAAVIGVGVLFAFAETARAETLEVNVPFAFTVGNQQLPAGQYRLQRESFSSTSVIFLRGEHGNRAQLFLQTIPLEEGNPTGGLPALVFVQHERDNRLTQIWESGNFGHEVPPARGHSRVTGTIVVPARVHS